MCLIIMIVNYTEKGWEIITQRAHGLLAAQIAMQWRKTDRPDRWPETVLAIAEHDDATTELDSEDLLTQQGGPVNFKMKKFELEHCVQLQNFSILKSRFNALLCSMHMTFLHQKEAETNPEVKKYLNEQVHLQAKWRKELKISPKEANRVYGLMEWCDAFSLLLCQQEVQPESRMIDVSQGPDDKKYQLRQKPNGALSVEPWPFEPATFSLNVEFRIIEKLQFQNNDEFKAEFLKADVQEKRWTMEK
jgi:hypothetical protein